LPGRKPGDGATGREAREAQVVTCGLQTAAGL